VSATQLYPDRKDHLDCPVNLEGLDLPECPESLDQKAHPDQSAQQAHQANLEHQASLDLTVPLDNQGKMLNIVLAHHARLCSRQRNALRIEQMRMKREMI